MDNIIGSFIALQMLALVVIIENAARLQISPRVDLLFVNGIKRLLWLNTKKKLFLLLYIMDISVLVDINKLAVME